MAAPEAPTISVVISCYNLGAYLDEAIQSVLTQTYENFDIIIVDDGSTDRATQALLDGYSRPRTEVLRAPHAGIATARNLGVAHARGRYLCILDADDSLEPTYFEKAVRVLDADASVTFVSCWLRAFGDESWEWKPERCDVKTLLSEDTVLTASLVRKDAVLAVGGFDTAMPEQGDDDWHLWLTLVARGYTGVILPEILYNYRRRGASVSRNCWHGPAHMPLARYRVAKYADAYRAHLMDVLLRQESETAALLRRNDELERSIATDLEPSVARRRDELASLRARLATVTPDCSPDRTSAALERRVDELEAALHAASAEVAAFRGSASWRITGPLRDVYGWWLRMRGAP